MKYVHMSPFQMLCDLRLQLYCFDYRNNITSDSQAQVNFYSPASNYRPLLSNTVHS